MPGVLPLQATAHFQFCNLPVAISSISGLFYIWDYGELPTYKSRLVLPHCIVPPGVDHQDIRSSIQAELYFTRKNWQHD